VHNHLAYKRTWKPYLASNIDRKARLLPQMAHSVPTSTHREKCRWALVWRVTMARLEYLFEWERESVVYWYSIQ
jgi:hypothetical protein